MSYEWTASEVWDLVREWPEEARADIAYTLGAWHFATDGGEPVDGVYAHHAAALHVASGLEFLCRTNRHGDVNVQYAGDINGDELWLAWAGNGPTLLHAISAAIRAVGGGA